MSDLFDDMPAFPAPRPRRPAGARAEPGCVHWQSVHCPRCGSSDCPVVDSHAKPLRWHVCHRCQHRFKSFETNYSG